jgi:hypothetical protein
MSGFPQRSMVPHAPKSSNLKAFTLMRNTQPVLGPGPGITQDELLSNPSHTGQGYAYSGHRDSAEEAQWDDRGLYPHAPLDPTYSKHLFRGWSGANPYKQQENNAQSPGLSMYSTLSGMPYQEQKSYNISNQGEAILLQLDGLGDQGFLTQSQNHASQLAFGTKNSALRMRWDHDRMLKVDANPDYVVSMDSNQNIRIVKSKTPGVGNSWQLEKRSGFITSLMNPSLFLQWDGMNGVVASAYPTPDLSHRVWHQVNVQEGQGSGADY